jgi:pentatricopeptide repeat protein
VVEVRSQLGRVASLNPVRQTPGAPAPPARSDAFGLSRLAHARFVLSSCAPTRRPSPGDDLDCYSTRCVHITYISNFPAPTLPPDGRCLHTTAQSAYDDQPRRYRERDGDYNNNAPRRYNNQNGGNGIFSERRNDGRLRSQPFRQAPNTDFRGNNTGASIDRYNINIGDAVGRTQLSQALRLCAEMKAQRVIPNLTTYHHLLRGFADAAMYPESLAVLEDMERVGVQPDQLAYHFVMQARPRPPL